ncbi:MAG: hypothetical protein ABFE07_27860 [Armatimonadia bacterium]
MRQGCVGRRFGKGEGELAGAWRRVARAHHGAPLQQTKGLGVMADGEGYDH